jgi:hypothetical protein
MTGLRDAIVSSRQVRLALRGDLVRRTNERRVSVSALCAGFARDRAGAHRAWFGPGPFEAQTAEKHRQRRPAEPAAAKAPAEEHPPTAANAEPRRREPAKPGGPLPQARKPLFKKLFKGSKKH